MTTQACCAGFPDAIESSLPAQVADWRVEGEDRFYDPATIFEYIDGAGEVYRAYNMEKCLSRTYVGPRGARLILDIFAMGSPEDAYGVFTHDRDGDSIRVEQEGLYKSGWLRFWKHRFFVSVFDETQTPDSRETAMKLAEEVSALIREKGEKPRLVGRLPSAGLDSRTIRYLHDPVILNSHFYLSDDNILLLGPRTEAVLAEFQRDGSGAKLLLVSYPDEGRAKEACQSFLKHYLPDADREGTARMEDRKWAAAALQGRLLAIVLEAGSRESARELLAEALAPVIPN